MRTAIPGCSASQTTATNVERNGVSVENGIALPTPM